VQGSTQFATIPQLSSAGATFTHTAPNLHVSAATPSCPRVVSPDAGDVGLYVSLPGKNKVLGFKDLDPKNKGPVCRVSSGITFGTGISTDDQGNLYVTNRNSNPATISIYGPGCGAQTASVSDPYGIPFRIAVSGATFYVANQYGNGSSGANVAVCSASGCSAELTGPSPGIGELFGVAVDGEGNVYAAGYPPSNGTTNIYGDL
jgi:hypothetical protein